MPDDRSFAYGRIFIWGLLALFGSLKAVVVAQSLASGVTGLLLAVILDRVFRAPRWVSGLAAVLYTIEPVSFLHEHMIMTESMATLFFTLFMIFALLYVDRPRLVYLLLLPVLSAVVVAFRISTLPVLMMVILAVPLLAIWPQGQGARSSGRGWLPQRSVSATRAVHLAVVLLLTYGCQTAYQSWFQGLTGKPGGYNSIGSLFLLAAWSPLVLAKDFPDPAMGREILAKVPRLKDRIGRSGQMFQDGGLIKLLVGTSGGWQSANQIAQKVVRSIARRDGFGVLRLGGQTYLDFWDSNVMEPEIRDGAGDREIDNGLINIFRDVYHEDVSNHYQMVTPSKVWYVNARPWYLFILVTPVFLAMAYLLGGQRRNAVLLLFLANMTALAVITIPVTLPGVRYLHPLAWLTILAVMVLVAEWVRWRAGRAPMVGDIAAPVSG